MSRQFTTSAKPLGYYVSLPVHIEQTLGSYFENVNRPDQFTLLAAIGMYMSAHAALGINEYTLRDALADTECFVSDELTNCLDEIECLNDNSILGLLEALVINLRTTKSVG
jgi:hypothetical protein